MKNLELAPIVLFTYNRPLHTSQLLDSLAANTLAKESVLYVFCDGVKANVSDQILEKIKKVRNIIKNENRFKKVIITIHEHNLGLANSVIKGVTTVINKYNKVIVLEDDLILSPFFLQYMNDSLNRYDDNFSVGQIGACNFFACGEKYPDYFFVSIPDCWGWATWRNRWEHFKSNIEELEEELNKDKNKIKIFNAYDSFDFMNMLNQQKLGKINSWAIRWQAVCVLKGWLTLYPNPSMSNHIESDEATHANKNIMPPLCLNLPIFKSVKVIEIKSVIKALKLGYSGKGNYFGKLKRPSLKKRIKKIIKIFIPLFFTDYLKKLKKWLKL
ncbi:glycosyltransferase [uncultured Lutibacter sp.]|uniref:glycosyltransferase n=1 Tax=uncultured Lutibacter sp. TaxID=437739 RepID=UPI00261D42E0|nr:glycosyltransferase [uncultured Lutibacter sp.]